ncbi:uncharacterized protein F4807DRAFT_421543 [Annulohypoxylon truncatum]|uniref:uncharacterized protein n=1 Tax=Annulohypoxylon truncatum TaxID=327061 RepID=UPI002008DAAB|nr:uncharacterized protein F4807DRAFT_421543 [Annulohypoxylon truncatum]KAI1211085.1 hypothetical protein F4807DRAFT_421543 [Annulohypoxylon truncatum]
MLTSAICQPTPRARSLQTVATARNALRPTNTSLLKAGHRQQIRGFRFGMWASYLDPEFQKEMRHRHRAIKYKYIEAINRRLSWDQRTIDGHPKTVLKHMLRRYWDPNQVRCGSRFFNHDELNSRQQHARNAQDIEHERGETPWHKDSWKDNHTNHRSPFPDAYDVFKSRMDETTKQWRTSKDGRPREDFHPSSKEPTESTSAEASSNQKDGYVDTMSPSPMEDYIIDPITNRKVLRKGSSLVEDTPSTTNEPFRVYRSQFAAFNPPEDEVNPGPIHSNGPPPPKELKEYGQIKVDQVPPYGVDSDGHRMSGLGDNAESSRPSIIESEEYALNHLPAEEPAEPEPPKKYEDLDKYKTYGAREAENDSEVPQNREELREYRPYLHNESTETETRKAPYDDLDKYGPYKHDEDVVRDDDTSPKYDDLDNYQHYSDEAKQSADDLTSKYEDLSKYKTTDFQDSLVEERPFQEYGDLEKYKTFKYQEFDDKNTLEQDIVAESLKEFEAKEQGSNLTETPRPSVADRLKKLDLNETPSPKSSASAPSSSSFHQSSRHLPTKSENWESLERSMVSHNQASDAADREASSNVRESRAKSQDDDNHASKRTFTGNYVRDFPEDFSGSWGTRASNLSSDPVMGSESSITNEKAAHIQAAEKQYAEQLSNPAQFEGSELSLGEEQKQSKLEPALDRQDTGTTENKSNHDSVTQAEVDPYSKEPQGLETSYTKECDGEHDSPTFKTYGGEPEPSSVKADANPGVFHLHSSYYRDPELDGRSPVSSLAPEFKLEPSRTTEPTVYKILAYDSSTQKINIAETTSIVPDQAAPLTPAEVLLRLSNPTKFFPHFAPLQAEGFEIVSGEGDVLVFRQVRHSKAADSQTGAPVNPIDLMGKSTALPNAAAFVSPTGFVNYDVPKVEEESQTTPFRSGIDVRREEPVFSGPKVTKEEAKKGKGKKKRSLGKRALLGGAWVAGISYGLGVVSEYFKTGGLDGRGPKGF